jgi:hypothetical protein
MTYILEWREYVIVSSTYTVGRCNLLEMHFLPKY